MGGLLRLRRCLRRRRGIVGGTCCRGDSAGGQAGPSHREVGAAPNPGGLVRKQSAEPAGHCAWTLLRRRHLPGRLFAAEPPGVPVRFPTAGVPRNRLPKVKVRHPKPSRRAVPPGRGHQARRLGELRGCRTALPPTHPAEGLGGPGDSRVGGQGAASGRARTPPGRGRLRGRRVQRVLGRLAHRALMEAVFIGRDSGICS
mmetsp:Transcript_47714/g.77430  ORF Transcript_47714/g.77430 Transcript_47714/m.77430 type:complete len:200 (+) Transcript_47714:145-744(+)